MNYFLPLKLGSKSAAVVSLQQWLRTRGLFNRYPTGYFGRLTESAVYQLQRQLRVTKDGEVGPETLRAMVASSSDVPESLRTLLTVVQTQPGRVAQPAFPDAAWHLLLQYREMEVRPSFARAVEAEATEIQHFESRYAAVSAHTGVPWMLVGLVHQLEADGWWTRHLHNGDPLTARTRQVPKGRPVAPPENGRSYTWLESAVDAMRCDRLDKVSWSSEVGSEPWICQVLHALARYNGLGYEKRGVPNPYLFSGTTIYRRGKYVADGVWSASAVSQQTGAAPVLQRLLQS